MNERIKELAEQAGLKVESWMTNPPKPFQILGSTEQFEQFAELIVRECAQSVTWYTKQERNWPNNGQVLRANKTVLEHFGVEE